MWVPCLEATSIVGAYGIRLLAVAIYRPPDVRPILKAFHGKDIPVEYAKQEAEAKKRHIEAWQQGGAKRLSESGFTLSGMFGGSTSVRSLYHTDSLTVELIESSSLIV